MEIRKQATWSETRPELFHYRTQTGQEVDLLLEDARAVPSELRLKLVPRSRSETSDLCSI